MCRVKRKEEQAAQAFAAFFLISSADSLLCSLACVCGRRDSETSAKKIDDKPAIGMTRRGEKRDKPAPLSVLGHHQAREFLPRSLTPLSLQLGNCAKRSVETEGG